MKLNWKKLIFSILLPVVVGAFSAFLTNDNMEKFGNLNQPPLSPPAILFPIVWTVLYVLMGISFYLVNQSDAPSRRVRTANIIYGVQLAMNFFWSIIFFNLMAYMFAFVWLVVLWMLTLAMIIVFRPASKAAAYLQIPYLLWLTFAGYLNIMIYLLNS